MTEDVLCWLGVMGSLFLFFVLLFFKSYENKLLYLVMMFWLFNLTGNY